MGLGCNAAAVSGCRIINSPRERLIAIATNCFVPCNGRFPMLIAVITMFFAGTAAGVVGVFISAVILTAMIVLGITATLVSSWVLSKSVLRGVTSSFVLELPPYRRPQIGRVIIRSLLDRTVYVLARAVTVAAPAGLVIWILANVRNGEGITLLAQTAGILEPFAQLIGLDGVILLAFILGFPANEIVLPIIIMAYMAQGSILEIENMSILRQLLVDNGWTWVTAVNVLIFTLMHWPCSTTLLTIRKETQSIGWTLLSLILPTVTGVGLCIVFTTVTRLMVG